VIEYGGSCEGTKVRRKRKRKRKEGKGGGVGVGVPRQTEVECPGLCNLLSYVVGVVYERL